jgi:hypothetical protein
MKYVICTTLLASLLAVPLSATEGHNADKNDAKAMSDSGHRRAADRMKEKLGLDDAQAKKFDAAWLEHRKAVKPLREQLHKALRKVHGELDIEASDKDIQVALDQVDKARESLRAETDQFKKTMDAMLTPTQRAQMLVMREQMMRRGMAMEHGRRGFALDRRDEGGHEDWRARDSREDRGDRHGPEGQKGWDHDQEQED